MEAVTQERLTVLRSEDAYDLILRPIEEMDTERIVRWRNNNMVRSQFIFREPLTKKIHNNWLKTKVFAGYVIQYIIEVGPDRVPIGSVYLRDIDLQNESGEFGIFIGEEDYLSKGIGTSAAKLFVSFCISLGFHRIFLRVFSENIIAQNSYRKVGFEVEGIARDMVRIEGQRHDIVFMSILG